ncbi:hypothetical protein [Brenneria roseae]|uniref:hypothetical protein n=1 Tax=Brenneria roseae TaxID=1509241 RepID=UPI00109E0BE3|nr:hypothetical protein [Brenneria roseae]
MRASRTSSTTGAVERQIDKTLSKESYFYWRDGGANDEYQISIVMKLTDGSLALFLGNNDVDLTSFLNSDTPYLNYNEKISNMVGRRQSVCLYIHLPVSVLTFQIVTQEWGLKSILSYG